MKIFAALAILFGFVFYFQGTAEQERRYIECQRSQTSEDDTSQSRRSRECSRLRERYAPQQDARTE